MPTTYDKRRKEMSRKERQANKRLRRDDRRLKKNLPSEEGAVPSSDVNQLDAEAEGTAEAQLPTEAE